VLACSSVVGQVMRPSGLTLSPSGPETSAKVSVLVGISESVAMAVAENSVVAWIVWFGGGVSTGGELTSRTVTWKVRVALRGGVPLSVTRTVMFVVIGPCSSVGVQRINPGFNVYRPLLIVAPGGGLIRE